MWGRRVTGREREPQPADLVGATFVGISRGYSDLCGLRELLLGWVFWFLLACPALIIFNSFFFRGIACCCCCCVPWGVITLADEDDAGAGENARDGSPRRGAVGDPANRLADEDDACDSGTGGPPFGSRRPGPRAGVAIMGAGDGGVKNCEEGGGLSKNST